MRALRWGRADSIGLEAVLWVAAALGVLGLVPRVRAALQQDRLEVTAELPESAVPAGSSVEAPLTGTVVIEDPTGQQAALALLPDVLAVLLVVAAVGLLLRVVRSVGAGDPFPPENARRLTGLALLVGVGGVAVQVVAGVVRNELLVDVTVLGERVPVVFELSLWPLLAMLLLAFLAQVFVRGAALSADVDGLV